VCYSHRSTPRPDHTQSMLYGAGRLGFPEQPLEAVDISILHQPIDEDLHATQSNESLLKHLLYPG
jgi:hypothetical protein